MKGPSKYRGCFTSRNCCYERLVDTKTLSPPGLGYGVMSAMFMYVNVLSEASGPGTYYTPGSPSMPIFVSGALQGSVMTFLHVCWGLLCSEAVEKRDWKLLLGVTLSHMVRYTVTLSHLVR